MCPRDHSLEIVLYRSFSTERSNLRNFVSTFLFISVKFITQSIRSVFALASTAETPNLANSGPNVSILIKSQNKGTNSPSSPVYLPLEASHIPPLLLLHPYQMSQVAYFVFYWSVLRLVGWRLNNQKVLRTSSPFHCLGDVRCVMGVQIIPNKILLSSVLRLLCCTGRCLISEQI